MPVYADLTPTEALAAARRDAAAGIEDAWSALDRCLRSHLLAYLQERTGDAQELREALLEAADWAREMERSPWQHNWPYLLGILRDGERLPSTATGIDALDRPEGLAARMLALLVENQEPMRPKELAEQLGLKAPHVSNLGKKLEDAGLIFRQKAKGRATWLFATPRGRRLAPVLPLSEQTSDSRDDAKSCVFWEGFSQTAELALRT